MKIDELKERLNVLNLQALEIQGLIEKEDRDLTAEEAANLDNITAAFDRTKGDIDRLERLQEQTQVLSSSNGRRTAPDQVTEVKGGEDDEEEELAPRPTPRPKTTLGVLGVDNGRDRDRQPATYVKLEGKRWNFRSLGDFANAVKNACLQKNGGQWDQRLQVSERLAAATTYGSEGVGSDGGFAVPPDFRNDIMEMIQGEDSLLGRCDQITVAGNSFSAPIDNTTDWQTTGGIQAYWGGEAVTKQQSKPLLTERSVKLNKIYALVPMTDESLEDAPAMEAYIRKKAPRKIAFQISLAIFTGNGVGKPLGVLKSPALVSVAKESSPGAQATGTLVGNNILKMYNRMYPGSRGKSIWLINPDIEPQLYKLSIPGTDNTGASVTGWGGLVYMPPSGMSQSPYASLMGRPVVPSQVCSTLGTQGDINLIDFSQYLAILKGGANPKVDTSIHLWFDQDLTAFRFVLRVGGIPWWDSAVASLNGSTTYSPYVTLDDRP